MSKFMKSLCKIAIPVTLQSMLQASSFFGISIPSYPQFNSRFTPLSSNEMNLLHTISVNIYLMLHPEPRIFQTSSITS